MEENMHIPPINITNTIVDWMEFFEIEKIAAIINNNQYKIVAIQVANHFLSYISDVECQLKKLCSESEFFVLADETYGNCCVDIITAKHYIPDLLIHYGNACFNHHNATYPVLYSFGSRPLSSHFKDTLKDLVGSLNRTRPFLVFYDLSYSNYVDELTQVFGPSDVIAHPLCSSLEVIEPICELESKVDSQCKSNADPGVSDCISCGCSSSSKLYPIVQKCNRRIDSHEYMTICGRKVPAKVLAKPSISDYDILLLSSDSPLDPRLDFNLSITFPSNNVYIYTNLPCGQDSLTQLDSRQSVKHLVRRSKYVAQVESANTIGFLLYGPAVQGLMPLAQNLRTIANKFGKKCVNVSIGRITVAKLANFLQVDLWVALSCYNNIYIDNTELYKPVITPVELVQGLIENFSDYETKYQLQFPYPSCTPLDINAYLETKKDSLIALSPFSGESYDRSCATATLWKGLEANNDVTVGDVVEGKSGIAALYDSDMINS